MLGKTQRDEACYCTNDLWFDWSTDRRAELLGLESKMRKVSQDLPSFSSLEIITAALEYGCSLIFTILLKNCRFNAKNSRCCVFFPHLSRHVSIQISIWPWWWCNTWLRRTGSFTMQLQNPWRGIMNNAKKSLLTTTGLAHVWNSASLPVLSPFKNCSHLIS